LLSNLERKANRCPVSEAKPHCLASSAVLLLLLVSVINETKKNRERCSPEQLPVTHCGLARDPPFFIIVSDVFYLPDYMAEFRSNFSVSELQVLLPLCLTAVSSLYFSTSSSSSPFVSSSVSYFSYYFFAFSLNSSSMYFYTCSYYVFFFSYVFSFSFFSIVFFIIFSVLLFICISRTSWSSG
jgi:hypothetical protein